MNLSILNNDVQVYINKNLNNDISKLIFKGSPFNEISIQEIAEQIEAKKRCRAKLPTWFNTQNIYYPNKLNIEQTSSEITADFKAKLITGNSIVDLTGGFGVDSFYFSKHFTKVIHCELDNRLSAIVKHNCNQLQVNNIDTAAIDGFAYLKQQGKNFDWIFIDPSRRNNIKNKVFLLKDCQPNLPKNLDLLFTYSDNLLIKASPILDINSAINELNYVKEVFVISIENEVKELLFILKQGFNESININTVNIKKKKTEVFSSKLNSNALSLFSNPKKYLYEPNAAILKAGLFNEISDQLNVYKLHNNSHLYTSNKIISFPGRKFKIIHQTKYDKKEILNHIPEKKANITTRNFPESVAQIRKKTKIKEGGNLYLFFTTDNDNKHIVLICEKV